MGLRTVLVVALAATAGWLVFRAVVTRRVPWVSLAIVAVLLVPLFVTERQWISAEHEFTSIARSDAPTSVGVHCQRFGEAFTYAGADSGHVQYDEAGNADGPAFLSYETCQRLTAYWRAEVKDGPPLEQVIAVHVLSHEVSHLAGVQSEAIAECDAMQRDADTAERLGATNVQGQRLAAAYLAQVYPDMASDYRSGQCVADSEWDHTPGDGVWP